MATTADLKKKWDFYRHVNDEGKAYTEATYTAMMLAMKQAEQKIAGNPAVTASEDELIALLDEKFAALDMVYEPESTKIPLWRPDNTPDLLGGTWKETSVDQPDFFPHLVSFLHEDGRKRPAIVVTSGGIRANVKEGFPYCRFFYDRGYNTFLVNHRMDKDPMNCQNFALDYQRAIRLIRHNADAWGVDADHIAGIGSSMGGVVWVTFLEDIHPGTTPDRYDPSYVCDEIDKEDDRLNAGLGIYTSSTPRKPRRDDVDYSVYPPVFWVIGNRDGGFKFQVTYVNDLVQHDVRVECRIYDGGAHGFGLGDGTQGVNGVGEQIPEIATWPEKALLWLKRVGF